MTREDAINMVKYILETMPKEPPTECDYVEEWFYEDNKIRKSLDMAIKALEQNPYEDAVSRKEVRNTIFRSGVNLDIDFVKVLLLQRAIKALPSVTPQPPRKGHWEIVSDGYSDNAYICECSECKDTVWVYKDADRKWNFCPNCGADMREVKE